MTRTNTFEQSIGATIEGQYTLTRSVERVTQMGDRFKVLNLADCTGGVRVYAWEHSGLLERVPATTPTPIQARLYVRRFHGETIANLQAVRELDAHEVDNGAALLAWEACSVNARPALGKLADFVDQLEPKLLRQFLNRVLTDPRIASSITTCKGSFKHHHHEPGGLLAHSVEVMEIAGDMAGARLNPLEKAMTQVAALLHDLGKVRAVGSGNIRPTHYLLVSHESQTIRMLDPHLEWLRDRSPQIAAGLDYTLEFLAKHPAERGRALFLAGDLVCAADRMSAALDNHKGLDSLLAKTLPKQQPKAPPSSTRARRNTPKTNATNHQFDIVARHETHAAHRTRHQPNNNIQEGPFPWI
ncbi:MAG: HD domain-containing protein [Xanthomonadales bacterium]|nr:HD domain-containing protein [Xanthomonadales bacterium]ODU93420.1 MAG: hypothetical protein ABT18_08560 [Rhodanobacter sp. SCN 66-43]OJY83178.1 MAG: hypothetical protein BGP23_09075 [Xanthomonadales bacterium 66-474]